jgi:rod shape determining protein RodA
MAISPLFSTRPTLSNNEWQMRLRAVPWGVLLTLAGVVSMGCLALTSAGEGDFMLWAAKQLVRFGIGVAVLIVTATIDIRRWYRFALPLYAVGCVMLIMVDIFGHIGMGAQRWLDLGIMKIQPSELMKIFIVLALARYYHDVPVGQLKSLKTLAVPAGMIALPVLLTAAQPDLGTSALLGFGAVALLFVAGTPMWLYLAGLGVVAAMMPILWFMLHDYQRDRIMIFMNPESDPFGAGYHITQSKIALGSGGFWGKGFLDGTQARLDFLPEKHTDFIFTLWAEEMGFIGGVALLGIYFLLVMGIILQGMRIRHAFGRLICFGVAFNLSLYVMINIAMVMGVIPVVGVPLPFVSHGGTAILSNMFGIGLVVSAAVHRDSRLPTT